jgi:Flp pilus assembly protein TadG
MNSILKKRSGSIAIEALASLTLLFIAVYSMWGLSVFIYNQSRISTATQLAAQAGIIVANRDVTNTSGVKTSIQGVFAANLCGMLPGQNNGNQRPAELTCSDNQVMAQPSTSIDTASLDTSIECSNSLSQDFNIQNCTGTDVNSKKAIKVKVGGAVTAPFSLSNSLGGRTDRSPVISDLATVYSYSAK